VLAAPCQLCGWAGQEHGGSIPLADVLGSHSLLCAQAIRPHFRDPAFAQNAEREPRKSDGLNCSGNFAILAATLIGLT
jgi:hypothetical protein